MEQTRHYRLSIDEVAQALATDANAGLTDPEAKRLLAEYGTNQLREKRRVSPLGIFLDQFKNFIVWVLTGAVLISGFLGEWADALAILAIVVVNAILGFVQEYRAEKSLAALKKLSSPLSKVIRDGQRMVIPSIDVVPGDLIELEAGDHVSADSRLVWLTSNFRAQEASLTGESTPVMKTTLALTEKEVPLADRANMVYMGTSVSSGKARALVCDTGMRTELGRIAGMIQEVKEEATPLQKKLDEFGRWIVYLCIVLVGIVFALGVLRGGKIFDMFLTAVSLAVAAIPEGLPAVVTISLALGVQRMVRRHALIRKLPSVETLGCATVICSDKTGTLTKNEMTVRAIFAGGRLFEVKGVGYEPEGQFLLDGKAIGPEDHPDLRKNLACGVLCNNAELRKEGGVSTVMGDPTEGAILSAAAKLGLWKDGLETEFPFVEEIPFDSERKKMTIVRKDKGRFVAFVKGAPDVLLDDCVAIEEGGVARQFTEREKGNVLRVNGELAEGALRVLAVAYRYLEKAPDTYEAALIEKDLTFAGLIAMIDPPREEVKKAMDDCTTAGIKAVMITGDHKNTATAIARELGFFQGDSVALTGEELDRLGNEQFNQVVRRVPVYARVSPEHKLKIVRAWRSQGEIVAMTGDGVNDAPAVKEADIGVAMGVTGTDVTKEVSDMVITDDNFASVVAAVEEGRGIYDNLQKFIHYLLSCNAGEILVMFAASLIGLPLPLLPIQILWVNLVTDGMPALALGVDPVDPHVMRRAPRKPDEAVVTRERAFLMLGQGACIALCSLCAFWFVLYVEGEGIVRARTAAFIVLSCAQLFHAFNCRSMSRSVFALGILSNPQLVFATGVSFLMQVAVVSVPFLQKVFKTESLGALDWILIAMVSSFPLLAMEAVKAVQKRRTAAVV